MYGDLNKGEGQDGSEDGFSADDTGALMVVAKTVTVGDLQGGAIQAGVAAAGRGYQVTTANIDDGEAASITWYQAADKTPNGNTPPAGITIVPFGNLADNAVTLNVNVTESQTTAGDYYFTVTIDGVESAVKTLTIELSNITTIQVVDGQEAVVKEINNADGSKTVTVVEGTTVAGLLAALESTDGSIQSYKVTDSDSVLKAAGELVNGDLLEVTSEDTNETATYSITQVVLPVATATLTDDNNGNAEVSSPVAVANTGGELDYTLGLAGLEVGKNVSYTVTETSDNNGILTLLVVREGTLTSVDSDVQMTFTIVANGDNEEAKSAEFTIAFTGPDYQAIDAKTVRINLAPGNIVLGAVITGLDVPENVLQIWETETAFAATTEAGADNWTSSNTSVAIIVSGTGRVTALSAGTTEISYTTSDSGYVNSKVITVYDIAAVSNPIISDVVQVGAGSVGPEQYAQPEEGQTITWESSVPAKATIDAETGEITPIEAGETTISYRIVEDATGRVVCKGSTEITVLPAE